MTATPLCYGGCAATAGPGCSGFAGNSWSCGGRESPSAGTPSLEPGTWCLGPCRKSMGAVDFLGSSTQSCCLNGLGDGFVVHGTGVAC